MKSNRFRSIDANKQSADQFQSYLSINGIVQRMYTKTTMLSKSERAQKPTHDDDNYPYTSLPVKTEQRTTSGLL